jgi:hypothetical protein
MHNYTQNILFLSFTKRRSFVVSANIYEAGGHCVVQTQKDKYCIISLIGGSKHWN